MNEDFEENHTNEGENEKEKIYKDEKIIKEALNELLKKEKDKIRKFF